ncbi:MAG: hypothetical protein U0974_01885 [Gemmatimonadales bacterium]|nr:hypothetical protein [Gemmatimonadales bacterium]
MALWDGGASGTADGPAAFTWGRDCRNRADDFARSLLLPSAEMKAAFRRYTVGARGRLGPHDAAQLAVLFRVPLHALAAHLSYHRLIDEPTRQAILQGAEYASAWEALVGEQPAKRTSAFSERYHYLVHVAYERGEIGRSKAASLLEVPPPGRAPSGGGSDPSEGVDDAEEDSWHREPDFTPQHRFVGTIKQHPGFRKVPGGYRLGLTDGDMASQP